MPSTVIIGAGIIGVSTAYYLSDHQPPSTIHLVESSPELFSSASGYAGGFLAKDWFKPQVLSLGALSFELHKQLAAIHGGREKWHYSPTTSINYSPAPRKVGQERGADWLRHGSSRAEAAPDERGDVDAPVWLRRHEGDHTERVSAEGTTAQLDPLMLCRWLLEECRKRGVRVHHPATVTSVSTDLRGELSSVRIVEAETGVETDLPCTRVVIAAGAWSGRVFKRLFRLSGRKLEVGSLAGHSVVVRTSKWKGKEGEGCHAVFSMAGEGFAAEMFSRVGGEVWLGGLNGGEAELPVGSTGRTKVVEEAAIKVREAARSLLGEEVEIVREGLCFRPVTIEGLPVVGRMGDDDLGPGVATRPGADGGVYVATGHGPWGISLCLGTGVVVAEMAQGRPLSADVSELGLKMK
ncbi:FAD dependent oxidoreductase [Immersiella caudata]|uniref:FAD dependent oxidoreductase n=1 Tax=Immersiella caudata TaxID=314043 RepID=A0AA39XH42_9PEZI|nr:FAD dependent oxidoreductase [Immersiella caudata]